MIGPSVRQAVIVGVNIRGNGNGNGNGNVGEARRNAKLDQLVSYGLKNIP